MPTHDIPAVKCSKFLSEIAFHAVRKQAFITEFCISGKAHFSLERVFIGSLHPLHFIVYFLSNATSGLKHYLKAVHLTVPQGQGGNIS